MKPNWFRLLEEQRYGTGFTSQGPATSPRLGLTVAFLVGALREPPGNELASDPTIAELRDLLAARDHPTTAIIGHGKSQPHT